MWIDILWLIAAVIGLIRGWQKGLIISIFTSLAWLLGIIGALKLCSVAAVFIRDRFNLQSAYLPVISFVVIFLIIAFIIYLIGKLLEKIIQTVQLGFLNRIAGALLKLLIFTLLFSFFIWLINQAGIISPETKEESKTYTFLINTADWSINFFTDHFPVIQNIFIEIEQFFEKLGSTIDQTK